MARQPTAWVQRVTALSVLCLASAGRAAAPTPAPHAEREVLPEGVVPVHYELALAPDAEALSFNGNVAITIDVAAATSRVTLNAAGLTFDHARIDGGPEARVALDAKLGRATLSLDQPVAAGQHTLAIDYHGRIGRSTQGFFAMDYTGPDGPRRTLATNFEPADARNLLPCWDEPARKATFTVSVDVPKDRMAISNMPIARVSPLSPTLQRVRFAESPRMSTYLLFVAVGDFERIHNRMDGVDVGIVVKRGDAGKAGYALDQATKLLRYYDEYFGVPYPLPKLDLIAAPGEINGFAMENWGAIFYSQDALLFDPGASTERDRQSVFLVVAHEMAHQWFGDLVTMSWWSDLWLNEGFARWMQTYAADDLHREWETGLQAARIFESGKQADSVPSTHPVVQEVNTADQAEESFDAITYNKGAAIITMINAYVGRERFREGVREYMREHAFGNTVDTDLWRSVQKAAGLPIVDIEKDFTRQEGLPLVRATRSAGGVKLRQSRFADDPATISGRAPQHWRLPLAVGPAGGATPYLLLQGTADVSATAGLLINAGQLGYARVRYGDELVDALARGMTALRPTDQLGLLNDAWALGIAREAPASNIVRLAASLPADANPIVWERVLDMLTELDRHYAATPERAAFRHYALDTLAPLAARLGARSTAKEPSNTEILRGHLEEAQGLLGDTGVIASARARFAAATGTPTEQRAALNIVAAQADDGGFEALLSRAQQSVDPLEKIQLLRALAGALDPAAARRMADIALSDQVPSGTSPGLVSRLSRSHPDMMWGVLAPRLDDPQLPFSKQERWRAATDVAGSSSRPERIAELEAYEARSVPPEARKPFLGAVAAIRRNQRIASSVLPEIDRWIASRASAAGTR